MTLEQFAKLPKHAQSHIERLEGTIMHQKDIINDLTNNKQTPYSYSLFAPQLKPYLEDVRYIPSHKVKVSLRNGSWLTVSVNEDKVPGMVHVMTDYGVRVQGESYNTLYLIPEDIKQ